MSDLSAYKAEWYARDIYLDHDGTTQFYASLDSSDLNPEFLPQGREIMRKNGYKLLYRVVARRKGRT